LKDTFFTGAVCTVSVGAAAGATSGTIASRPQTIQLRAIFVFKMSMSFPAFL
jgi:hypothetical protein